MFYNNALLLAANEQPVYLLPKMANRHGLITGATGTGKTVTVKVLAESFSDAGVPVFLADIKGDLSGMIQAGEEKPDIIERAQNLGLTRCGWQFSAFPTVYWDVFAQKGIPVRATISEMGPILLSRLMDLTAAQEGVLNIVFKIADDQGLLLLDLKDLRAVVQAVGDNAAEYRTTYGNITAASIGGIQRGLLKLENQGAAQFFGEPALDIYDWIRCDQNGKGIINVLNCEALFQKPDLYAAYLLWMLSELYESLPEIGDPEKPKMVFFFDEAHLLFNLKSKELMEKVQQVIRLIRSKGVGVFFITQNPSDIPDGVLSQLGNKIQHALRAYTPTDQKAVHAAAQSFVINPAFKTEDVIPQLGKGEALVSFLDEKGVPAMVQRAFILPPQSKLGAADEALMNSAILSSDMYRKYSQAFDRESAYELLNGLMPSGYTLQGNTGGYMNTQQPGNIDMNNIFAGSQNQSDEWTCPVCSSSNTGKFCSNCGSEKPQVFQSASAEWVCPSCRTANTGNFCSNCGTPKVQQPQQINSPQQPQINNSQPQYSQPAAGYAQQPSYQGPSLVGMVQAQQAQEAARNQAMTQAQIDKIQKDALKQAKAELKAEQDAKKGQNDLAKSAKSIATSGARTAVNYLVRGALGNLLKK